MVNEVKILPNGWVLARIPDLIASDGLFIDGDWVESKDQDPEGDVRLIQLADVGDGFYVDKSHRFLTHPSAVNLGCTFLEKGDVLVARMPDPLGRACIFPGDKKLAVTVVDVCVVRGKNEHFDQQWLMHFINVPEFRERINELQSGSTRKRISRGNLSTLQLPIPPRTEQTRIVTKLEELLSDLDAGVAELKAAQKKLKQYRQSLLKAAVEGSLTAEWRKQQTPLPNPSPTGGEGLNGENPAKTETAFAPLSPRGRGAGGEGNQETGAQLLERILIERRARWEAKQLAKFKEQGKAPPKDWQKKYPEPVQPDTKDLPELPEGWVWASLGQLLAELTSGSRDWAPYYDRGSSVFVMAQNVRPWRPDFGFKQYIDPPLDHRDRFRSEIQTDDLLVTIVGANTGQVCRVAEAVVSHFVCQSVALLRLVIPDMSEYANAVLNSEGHGQRQFREMNYGAGRPHLSFDQLESVVVPLPPLSEQRTIIDVVTESLQAIEQKDSELMRLLKQSAAQRQNILRAAFAGKLVPQDPNDEPASVLLARIRAERAEREAVKKSQGHRSRRRA